MNWGVFCFGAPWFWKPPVGSPSAFKNQGALYGLAKEHTSDYVGISKMMYGMFLNSAILGSIGAGGHVNCWPARGAKRVGSQ